MDAWPEVLVIAGFGLKVPPAAASLNEIEAPETTFPDEFFAVATIGLGNVVPTVPVCLPPDEITRVATVVEVAVSVKVADVYPELAAVAVTVCAVGGRV